MTNRQDFPTNLQDFPTNVGVSYGDFVRNLFRPLAPAAMLAHAAMGVVTEIQELKDAQSMDNAIEEAGDIAFFCAAFIQCLPFPIADDELFSAQKDAFMWFCRKVDIEPMDFDEDDVMSLVSELSIELLDAAKRWLAYDKAPDNDKCRNLAGSAELIGQLVASGHATEVGTPDPQGVIDVNVAKLQHRYKGGFSTEAAVNRDVTSELKVIQGAVAS